MDQLKLHAILCAMEAEGIPQMIISDPAVIFYLTGAWIHPGERLLAPILTRGELSQSWTTIFSWL